MKLRTTASREGVGPFTFANNHDTPASSLELCLCRRIEVPWLGSARGALWALTQIVSLH